jgi:hypothetical protein
MSRCNRQIDPGKVFDLELPPDQAAYATGLWTNARLGSRRCQALRVRV